jgi:hypothetical protein
MLHRWSADNVGPIFHFDKSRATVMGTHTIVQNGDILGRIYFGGSDGNGFIRAAEITASVNGTPGTNDMPGRLTISTTADGAASPTDRILLNANGRMSLINGTLYIGANAEVDANYLLQLPNSATQKAKANAWDTYSDARIKTEVATIADALEKILKLRPVSYIQHAHEIEQGEIVLKDESWQGIGLLAQEVASVVPEAVSQGENSTELWAIDYSKFAPLLIGAVKELAARVATLESA